MLELSQKMTMFKLQKKRTKNNLWISAKALHAHLQTLTKTHAKFQKDAVKIVGGIVFTRVEMICKGQSDRQTDAPG